MCELCALKAYAALSTLIFLGIVIGIVMVIIEGKGK